MPLPRRLNILYRQYKSVTLQLFGAQAGSGEEMRVVRLGLTVAMVGFLIAVATPRQSYSQTLSPDCARLKGIGESNKQIKARRDRITFGDKAGWCPLNKEMIVNNSQMISIFESDPHRCGVRDEIIDNLKSSTQRLKDLRRLRAANKATRRGGVAQCAA